MTWIEKAKFASNPYQKLDPFKIDPSRLSWNRPDLGEIKDHIDEFVDDLVNGYKVGMRVIGAVGSGKTWLSRIIEIQLKIKSKNQAFSIYSKIPKIEPTFANIYRIAIKDFISKFNLVIDRVRTETGKTDLESWQGIFDDEDLAQGLSHICAGGSHAQQAKRWIGGYRVTSTELNTLNIINPIQSDYRRFEVLISLFTDLNKLFLCTLFIIDELENAPLKLASAFSDGLRDILSTFDEKFGLVCLFTAQSNDEWYDAGYTEALTRRIDYHIQITEVKSDAMFDLVRSHHRLYRTRGARIKGEQLFPFTPESTLKVYEVTSLGRKYPGYLFPNLESMIKTAHKLKIKYPINDSFIVENHSKLPYSTVDLTLFVK